MTTLPQPSTRYPRQSNGLATGPNGALPAVATPATGSLPTPQGGLTGGDVARVLRQNLVLILAAAILSLAAGYGIYWWLNQNHRLYTAQAYVDVEMETVVNAATGERLAADNRQITLAIEQAAQAQLLEREELIGDVLADPNSRLRQTEFFAQFDGDSIEAKRAIRQNLTVSPQRRSSLILVEFAAPTREDASAVLTDIIAEHLSQQVDRETGDLRTQRRDAETARTGIDARLKVVEGRIQSIIGEIGEDSALSGRRSKAEATLEEATRRQATAEFALREAQTALGSFNESIGRGEVPPLVKAAVDADPIVLRHQSDIDAIDLAINHARSKFGAEHKDVRDLTLRRDGLVDKLDNRRAEVEANQRAAVQAAMTAGVSSAQGEVELAAADVETASERVQNLAEQQQALGVARRDQTRLQESLARVEERLRGLQQAEQSNRSSTIRQQGGVIAGDSPTFPRRNIILAASLLVGVGLAVGLAFLREMMDTSVRSPRDVGRVGQMNLLGMVPHADDDPNTPESVEHAIARAPTGVIADQFRQIRARLNHAAPPEMTRTLLVTSAGPSDGKTTVASNLAAAMALSGRRILLVDANFRRGKLADEYNIPGDLGFGDALANVGVFAQAVHETELPNLALLPAGKAPEHATEAMEGNAFADFVQRALEDFDQIIFDGAPVMIASETAAMAPRVDGVVTVARASENSRGLLGRLRDTLRQLKAEHVGVVLNAVRSQAGGYYKKNMATYYDYSKRPELKA